MTVPTPLVIAHRGASHHHPPNTLDAFRAALVLGADGVELDVQLTRDGIPVVHHDPDLVDGRRIRRTAYAELPVWVPPLEAVIGACEGLRLINIEIKTRHDDDLEARCAAVEPVCDLVGRLGVGPRVLLSSFDLEALDAAAAACDLPTALLVVDPAPSDGPDAIAVAVEHGHHAVNPWYGFVDQDIVTRARAAGLAVHPWTVDDVAHMEGLAALGVDSIITNRPDLARTVLGAT